MTTEMKEAYFEWSTGHQPDTTLRTMLEQFNVPSDEWQRLLKNRNIHPDVLDLTYNEARDRPDNYLTRQW